jgi:hypothetical protein
MTASLLLALLALDTAPAAAQARGRVAPRGSAPQVGRAVPRVGPAPRAVHPGYRSYVYPYRPGIRVGVYGGYGFGYRYGYPYGYFGYPYGYVGYPYGYSYYPYAYGPYRYGFSAHFGAGYYGPAYYGGAYYGAGYWGSYGGVRIRDAQPDAQVLVDGYYAGIVDDFDGSFQRLNLEEGVHKIEIRTPNGPPLTFDVNVIAGQTITYRAKP